MKLFASSTGFLFVVALGVLSLHGSTHAESSSGHAKYKIRWIVAHGPFNLIEKATLQFAETVKRESKGEMEVEVIVPKGGYAEDALKPNEALASVAKNEFEMSQVYTTQVGDVDHRFWVLDLPFLFKNHRHAAKVLDGEIGKGLLSGLTANNSNLRGLAFTYSGGYRVIPTRNRPITKASDFSALKIAPMGTSPIFWATIQAFKSVPVELPKVGIPAAMQSGAIDAFESTYTRYGDMTKEQAVSKVLNETYHSLHLTAIVVNETFFQSLPENYRKILQNAAQEAALTERAISIAAGDEYRETKIKGAGIQVVTLPKAERAKLEKQCEPLAKRFPEYFSFAQVQKIRSLASGTN